jgi:hypothetical protein
LLLLVAAALKLHGLAVEPVAAAGIFSAPEIQVGLANAEALLGIWLLSGRQILAAWSGAVAAFTCFACTSFYLGWVGQASCACFGAVQVNPWYAFSLDILVLTALAVGRPDFKPLREQPRAFLLGAVRTLVGGGLAVVALLISLTLAAAVGFGSPGAALAYFRGEAVSITPRVVDVGEVGSGDAHQVTVELTNWCDLPVPIIGGTSDCGCDINHDLPLTIPARQSRPLTIRLRLPTAEGYFTRKALFRTDHEGARVLPVRIVGRISEP